MILSEKKCPKKSTSLGEKCEKLKKSLFDPGKKKFSRKIFELFFGDFQVFRHAL